MKYELMNDNITISIIVPVYKAEKFIRQGINSILAQTFIDFELILVDDGSLDLCGEICDVYVKADKRITVIHQKNAGVSAARNTGIFNAVGKYIIFCDSDDELDPDYLFHLIEVPEKYDLVISGYQIIDSEGKKGERNNFEYHDYLNIESKDLFQLIGNSTLSCAWGKRFKRSIIDNNNLNFNTDLTFAEDTLFSIMYTVHSKSVLVLHISDYCYRRYNENTLGSYRNGMYQMSVKADVEILRTVNKFFTGLEQSIQWKKRKWPILRNCLFGTLYDHDLSLHEKRGIIREIYNDKSFPRTLYEIKQSNHGEGRILVYVIHSRSALALMGFHKLYLLKRKILQQRII